MTDESEVAQSETPEGIASEIMRPAIGKVAPAIYCEMELAIVSALRNERERAARVAEAHLSNYRNNLSPSSVAATIREGR